MVDRAEGPSHASSRPAAAPAAAYRATLDVISQAAFQVDADGRVVDANDAFLERVGRTRDDALGTPLAAFAASSPDVRARLDDLQDGERPDGGPVAFEMELERDGAMAAGDEDAAAKGDEDATVKGDEDATTVDGEIAPAATGERADAERVVVRLRRVDDDEGGYAGAVGSFETDGAAATQATVERQFQALVQSVEEYAIFVLDEDGVVQTWNPGARRIKGYDAADVVGEHFSTFYTQRDREANVPERNLATAAAYGHIEDEGWRVRADGSRFWASVSITTIRDDDGELAGYAKVTRDMTARREYEQRLRRERDLTDRILETVPTSVVVVDADGRLVRANSEANRRLAVEEVDGEYTVGDRAIFDAEGDPVPPAERPYMQIFETGESVDEWYCQIALPELGRRWLSIEASPLSNPDGTVEYVVIAALDVTTLKEQADRLKRQRDDLESELETIFERVTDGFLAVDEEWRLTYANRRVEELFDVRTEEVVGGVAWETLPALRETGIEERCEQAMATQEAVFTEQYARSLDAWLELAVYPSESGLSIYFRDVTDRKQREQRLRRQRERLVALDHLNRVVREINEGLIEQTTREEMLQEVCDHLVASDSYRFAWVGRSESNEAAVEVVAQAAPVSVRKTVAVPDDERGGANGDASEGTNEGASEDANGEGSTLLTQTERAVRTHRMQVRRDTDDDVDERWHEHARANDYRASAAIPIVSEGTVYGVLNVYAGRVDAFQAEERAVVAHLGDTIGHALTALERKRALMSDRVTEIEFELEDVFEALGVDGGTDGTIAFERVVDVGDDQYLVYGTTTGQGVAAMTELAERLSHWNDLTPFGEDGPETSFHVLMDGPPIISTVAAHGGSVQHATVDDGTYQMRVHLPPNADVRAVVDAVTEAYPETRVVAKRRTVRTQAVPVSGREVFENDLTGRQQSALEAAYFSGFFEWPRDSNGEEVAAALDVSPPTFHYHLRAAERAMFAAVFESKTSTDAER